LIAAAAMTQSRYARAPEESDDSMTGIVNKPNTASARRRAA
jgi:hypothetical protein